MRYKVVPEPLGFDVLRTAHDAMPLVPDSVEDCCIRLVDRTEIASRDAAREWVTFMQALELVRETPRGFERRRRPLERDALADALEQRVFGVAELLDALETDGPLTGEAAFAALEPTVPEWERDRHTDWEAEWRERVRRLLGWAVAFELVTTDGGHYALADGT